MSTAMIIVVLALAVPAVAVVSGFALRGRALRLAADKRGIALQTIIIVVVLLAIAGAVAAVLLTRAGTETDRLEDETDRWSEITNHTGCQIAGGRSSSNASSYTAAATDGSDFAACFPPA